MNKFQYKFMLIIIVIVCLSKWVNAATEQCKLEVLPKHTMKMILVYLDAVDYFHVTRLCKCIKKNVLDDRNFADMILEMFHKYQQWLTNPQMLIDVPEDRTTLNHCSAFLRTFIERNPNLRRLIKTSILFTNELNSPEFLRCSANKSTEMVSYCQSNSDFIGYREVMRILQHGISQKNTYIAKNNNEKTVLPLVYDWYNKELSLYDNENVILQANIHIPNVIIFTDETNTQLYKIQVFKSRSKRLISHICGNGAMHMIIWHGSPEVKEFKMIFHQGLLDKLEAEIKGEIRMARFTPIQQNKARIMSSEDADFYYAYHMARLTPDQLQNKARITNDEIYYVYVYY